MCEYARPIQSFKHQQVYTTGRDVDERKDSSPLEHHKICNNITSTKIPAGLCGTPTEAKVRIEGIETKTILDIGSTVSTTSTNFYQQYLSDLPMKELNQFLKIECADGKALPYI